MVKAGEMRDKVEMVRELSDVTGYVVKGEMSKILISIKPKKTLRAHVGK